MWNLKCVSTFNARGTSMAAGVDGESYWPWSQGCKFMRWESEGQRGCWCLFLLSKKLIRSGSFIGSQTIQYTNYFLNEYLFNRVILTHLLCPCIHLYIHSFNKNLFLSNYMSLRLPRQQDHLQWRRTESVPSGAHRLVGETSNKCALPWNVQDHLGRRYMIWKMNQGRRGQSFTQSCFRKWYHVALTCCQFQDAGLKLLCRLEQEPDFEPRGHICYSSLYLFIHGPMCQVWFDTVTIEK